MSLTNIVRYVRSNPLAIMGYVIVLAFLWTGAWRERSFFCAVVGSMASIVAFFLVITDYSHQKMAWGTTMSPASLLAQKRATVRVPFDQHRQTVLANSQAMSYAPPSGDRPDLLLRQRQRDALGVYPPASPPVTTSAV